MKFFNQFFKPKELTPAERLKKGENVSIEEICNFLQETLPPEEKEKVFTEIELSVYPAVVQRMLELMDQGNISQLEFLTHLREHTLHINQLLDKKNETKVS